MERLLLISLRRDRFVFSPFVHARLWCDSHDHDRQLMCVCVCIAFIFPSLCDSSGHYGPGPGGTCDDAEFVCVL